MSESFERSSSIVMVEGNFDSIYFAFYFCYALFFILKNAMNIKFNICIIFLIYKDKDLMVLLFHIFMTT